LPRHMGDPTSTGITVRRDLFEKAGFKWPDDKPETLEDLTNIIEKLSDPPNVYGFHVSGQNLDGLQTVPIATAFTGAMSWHVDAQGTFQYLSYMPEYTDFLRWMRDLYSKRAINPEFPLGQNGDDMANGKAAAGIHRWWAWFPREGQRPNGFSELAPEDADTFVIGVVQGPKAPSLEVRTGFWTQMMFNGHLSDEKMAKILDLLEWCCRQRETLPPVSVYEGLFERSLFRYGKEGVHYTLEDGKVKTTDQHTEDGVGAWNYWMPHQPFIPTTEGNFNYIKGLGITDGDLQMAVDLVEDLGDAYDAFPKPAHPALPLFSPTFNDQWDELIVDLADMRVKAVTGDISLEEWEAYRQEIVSSETYKAIQDEYKAEWRVSR